MEFCPICKNKNGLGKITTFVQSGRKSGMFCTVCMSEMVRDKDKIVKLEPYEESNKLKEYTDLIIESSENGIEPFVGQNRELRRAKDYLYKYYGSWNKACKVIGLKRRR